ncbi:hypothetical protein BH10PSE17_BH10PSE17_15920 [soil metagenome]
MSLIRLAYASKRNQPFNSGALAAFVQRAYDTHARLGLTGVFAHSGFSCFHVIEGFAGDVVTAFEIFEGDLHHTEVSTVLNRPIARRSFGNWCLGVSAVPSDFGFEQRVDDDRSLADLGWGRASRLLVALERGALSGSLVSAADLHSERGVNPVVYETVPLTAQHRATSHVKSENSAVSPA